MAGGEIVHNVEIEAGKGQKVGHIVDQNYNQLSMSN